MNIRQQDNLHKFTLQSFYFLHNCQCSLCIAIYFLLYNKQIYLSDNLRLKQFLFIPAHSYSPYVMYIEQQWQHNMTPGLRIFSYITAHQVACSAWKTHFAELLVQTMYSTSSVYGFWKLKLLVLSHTHSRFLARNRYMMDITWPFSFSTAK